MKWFTLVLLALCLIVPALADDAAQTDWSGGDGVAGPVTDWGNLFDSETDMGYGGIGSLSLLCVPKTPIAHSVVTGLSLPDAVYSVDIDNDGDEDVVGAFWGSNVVYWFENTNGDGSAWSQHTVDGTQGGPRDVWAADFDDDGDSDLLGAIHGDNRLVWWENVGGGSSWTYHTIDSYLRGCSTVRAADIDGDGDPDAVATGVNVSGDLVVWWENIDSGGSWTEHIITTDPYYPRGMHCADVDGDDDLDVAIAAWNDNEISWWENDGSGGGWAEHTVGSNFRYAYSVYSADLDGDGDNDMMGASANGDGLAWWSNTNGDGTAWSMHVIDPTDASEHYVTAADVDFDGDIDVLEASYGDNQIAWWENNGDASGWTEHVISNSCSGADMVRIGDIDGNGTLDAVGAAYLGGDVNWWEIVEYADSGELTSSIFDTGGSAVGWGTWDYSGTLPTDTALTVEARSSNNAGSMGAWVELAPDDLSGNLADGDRYLQYRLSLSTTDNDYSPIVRSIYFTWSNDSAIESVDLYANSRDEGVLLSWSVVGDTPTSVSVLRSVNENQPITLSGELAGSATSWLDVSAEAGMEYAYYLEVTELDGTVSRFGPSEVVVPGMVSELVLSDPYPNPVSSALTISYELATDGAVELNIYDLSGRLVETLVSGNQTAGRYSVSWDSSTSATGVYLLCLEAAGEAVTKRAVVSR